MGNVFEQGIQGAWLGEAFRKIRHDHETGQFDKAPFCKDWSRHEYTSEEVTDHMLVRRSPLPTSYHRIDRLDTWRFDARRSMYTSE